MTDRQLKHVKLLHRKQSEHVINNFGFYSFLWRWCIDLWSNKRSQKSENNSSSLGKGVYATCRTEFHAKSCASFRPCLLVCWAFWLYLLGGDSREWQEGWKREGRRCDKDNQNKSELRHDYKLCASANQDALCHFLLDIIASHRHYSIQPDFFRSIMQSQTALSVCRRKAVSPAPHFAGIVSKVIVVIILHGDAPHRVTAQG